MTRLCRASFNVSPRPVPGHFQLSPDWTIDYESYDWKKLDSSSDETKKIVDRYFRWEGEDSKGRKANTGKIFK